MRKFWDIAIRYYWNAILMTLALLAYLQSFLDNGAFLILAALFWFLVGGLIAIIQFIHGLFVLIKYKDRKALHHCFSAIIAGINIILLNIAVESGLYITA